MGFLEDQAKAAADSRAANLERQKVADYLAANKAAYDQGLARQFMNRLYDSRFADNFNQVGVPLTGDVHRSGVLETQVPYADEFAIREAQRVAPNRGLASELIGR